MHSRKEHLAAVEWVQLGLPFGSKPRLILAHLNAEALKIGMPKANVGDSLTALSLRNARRSVRKS